jgi:hypothetical protein
MADIMNFEIKMVGGNIRIYGDVVDSETQTQTLATFGPNGQSYNAWWTALTPDEQLDFVREHAAPIMIDQLLATIRLRTTRG